MTKTSEKIVFFGSGPVASRSLELLVKEFDINLVITKPNKPGHNDPTPVIDIANKYKIKTYLPSNRSELDDLIKSENISNKIAILIDYGIIVSQTVIDHFPLGIVNSHFSLLPKWRGADPISFSILSGDPLTGVSLMLLTKGMDEGPLLDQKEIKLLTEDNSVSLTKKLIDLSNDMLVDSIPKYINGDLKPYEQPTTEVPTYSRKLTKADGIINWSKTAKQIEQEIRAYIEWPKSHAKLVDRDIIITKAHTESGSGSVGSYYLDKTTLKYFCGEDVLIVDRLKPSGKNEMHIKSFLAGYKSTTD